MCTSVAALRKLLCPNYSVRLVEGIVKIFEWKMRLIAPFVVMCCLISVGSQIAQGQTTYTSDNNIAHFTAGVSGTSATTYATFSHYTTIQGPQPPCVSTEGGTFTPDPAELATYGCRVVGGTLTGTGLSTTPTGQNWIEATFPSPVSAIMVFPNIDHFGSPFDGFQYSIAGTNDDTETPTWTMLYDATSVNGTGEPFTLGGTSAGSTAPWAVNNVLTPQSIGIDPGCTATATPCAVGYIAQFQFGTAYKHYAFGASTEAINAGNLDQELSAVRSGEIITQTLLGNGAVNSFVFPFVKTYNVIYPADVSITSGTTMTILANDLSQTACNSQVVTVQLVGGSPTTPPAGSNCTTYTNLNGESAIFDVVCAVGTATPSSSQCPPTTGFNPFPTTTTATATTTTVSGSHSGEDISNIVSASTDIPPVPQMLTAQEGTTNWFPIGVGFQDFCCTGGGGTSGFNSLMVLFEFPTTSAATFAAPAYTSQGSTFFLPPLDDSLVNVVQAGSTIPVKFCINYGTNQALGFSGGPYTTLNFPPLGYLSVTATQNDTSATNAALDNIITDTITDEGLHNLGGGCYNVGLKTQKGVTGTFTVRVNLGDGPANDHDFTVMFK
jgi:hypothetical protein